MHFFTRYSIWHYLPSFGNQQEDSLLPYLPPELLQIIIDLVCHQDRTGQTIQSLLRVSKVFSALANSHKFRSVSLLGVDNVERFVKATEAMPMVPVQFLFLSDRNTAQAHEMHGFPPFIVYPPLIVYGIKRRPSPEAEYAEASAYCSTECRRFNTAIEILIPKICSSLEKFNYIRFNPYTDHIALASLASLSSAARLSSLVIRIPRMYTGLPALPPMLRSLHLSFTRKLYNRQFESILQLSASGTSLQYLVISGVGLPDYSFPITPAVAPARTIHSVVFQPFTTRREGSLLAQQSYLPFESPEGFTWLSSIVELTLPEWHAIFVLDSATCSFGATVRKQLSFSSNS